MPDRETYDVAVSFAGAQRDLVEHYVRACETLGLRVFYDRDVTARMWGRNFVVEFRRIYGHGIARYVVPFLSHEYLLGPYPLDEYNAALTWSIELREDAYILPILVGDVRVPEELLSSATAHLRSEEWSVEELAKITAERVRGVVPDTPPPSAVSASGVLLPRIGLGGYSPLETLTNVLPFSSNGFRRTRCIWSPTGTAAPLRTGAALRSSGLRPGTERRTSCR